MSDDKNLADFLKDESIKFARDISLSTISMIKAGGICKYLVYPDTESKVLKLIAHLYENSLPYLFVGRLSNIIIRDGLIETIIISTSGLAGHGFAEDGLYRAECGAGLPEMARRLSQAGFSGFSGLVGVPASVGGAAYMNASCYGNAISDHLVRLKCCNERGEVVFIEKAQAGFSWRHSAFHGPLKDTVILAAYFEPPPGDPAVIAAHLEACNRNRRDFQEQRYPNLGSSFATRDIYGALAARFPGYRPGYWLIRLWVRLRSRDRDLLWRRLINRYTQRYFRIGSSDRVGLSECTFNCLVNKGGANAAELIAFLRKLEGRIRHCLPLEITIFEDIP